MHLLGKPAIISEAPGGSSMRGPHRLSLATQCEMKWALRYGLRHARNSAFPSGVTFKTTNETMLTGTLFHLFAAYGFAELMEKQGRYTPPKWLHTIDRDEEAEKQAGKLKHCIVRAQDCYTAFAKQYNLDSPQCSLYPFAVEKEYITTLGDLGAVDEASDISLQWEAPDGTTTYSNLSEEIVSCRTDLVLTNRAGDVLMLADYKTSGSRTETLPPWSPRGQYLMNLQMHVNLLLARHLEDLPVKDMMVWRVKQYSPYHFDKHPLHLDAEAPGVTQDARDLLRHAVMDEVRITRKLDNRLPVLKSGQATDNCSKWGRACEFTNFCAAKDPSERRKRLEHLVTLDRGGCDLEEQR